MQKTPGFSRASWAVTALPDGTVSISAYNGSAVDVVIPPVIDGKKVTEIGEYAFDCNTSMQTLCIPEGVLRIADMAFTNCNRMTAISLPESLLSIGAQAFGMCFALRGISIPRNLSTIGPYAFSMCESLSSISVDPRNKVFEVYEGMLLSRREQRVIVCAKNVAGAVDVPSWITSIDEYAFADCAQLTKVLLQDGLQYISERAFANCGKLHFITIPDSVTGIGENAFCGCGELMHVSVPARCRFEKGDMGPFDSHTRVDIRP